MRRRIRLGPIVAAFCVALGACSPDASQPGATPEETPAAGTGRDYHRFAAAPQAIATGILQGMTPDGSAAYVADTDPAFPQPGCEGQPEAVLFRQPLDGGERELLRAGGGPVKGEIVRGRDGLVALVALCEGFFTGLSVGRETPEGHIEELRTVDVQTAPGSPPAPFSISWSPDGRSLLAAINDPEAPDGGPSRLVRIDPESGAVSTLFTGEGGSGVFQFAQLRDGSYVVSSNREVTFRDERGRIEAQFPGAGFVVFPDHERVLVYGETVAVAREGDDQARVVAPARPGREVSSASISPDGEAAVFNRYALEGSENEVSVVTIDDGTLSTLASGEGLGEPFFAGDGAAIGFNRFEPGPEFSPRVMLAELEG